MICFLGKLVSYVMGLAFGFWIKFYINFADSLNIFYFLTGLIYIFFKLPTDFFANINQNAYAINMTHLSYIYILFALKKNIYKIILVVVKQCGSFLTNITDGKTWTTNYINTNKYKDSENIWINNSFLSVYQEF